HLRDVLAVNQDAPRFQIEEAQEQIDEGRFSGAGAADKADFFAGLHEQGQALDHPGFAAIAEMNILEADLSTSYLELLGIWMIDEHDWAGDGHHALLDHSDILEDGRNLPGDPAGDVDDLPGERECHAHRADLDLALRPQNEGERAGARYHGGVERRKAESEQ